jgi:two-component system, NarL family, nitrate/nitrite response regulator NarL
MSDRTIRVLLIDDHRSVLWGLEKLIDSQRPRMQVVGKFTSFSEASGSIETLQPDIILLDLDLGAENGVDHIPHLKALSSANIVILSGSRDSKLLDQAVVAGAKGILGKEASAETIISAIERVNEGQLWIDHERMGRILNVLSNKGRDPEESPEKTKLELLTPKEKVIFQAMTTRAGSSGSEVAKLLHISESTLRNHLTSIYSKLELTNRLELWDFAQKLGVNKMDQ